MIQKKRTSLSRAILLVSILCTVIPSLVVGVAVHTLLYRVQMQYVEEKIMIQTDIISESIMKNNYLVSQLLHAISTNTTVRSQISWPGKSAFPYENYKNTKYIENELFVQTGEALGQEYALFLLTGTDLYFNTGSLQTDFTIQEYRDYLTKNYLDPFKIDAYRATWLKMDERLFGKPMLTYARHLPFLGNAGEAVYLLLFIDPDLHSNNLGSILLGKDDEVYLLDADGNLLFSLGSGADSVPNYIDMQENGYWFSKGGDKLMKTYQYQDGQQLVICVSIGDLQRNLRLIRIILVGSVFLMVSIALFIETGLLKKATGYLHALVKSAHQISLGNFEERPERQDILETDQLALAIDHMRSRLKRRFKNIQQQQEVNIALEINAYQSRLNPHFIFNTLNDIKWMALSEPKERIVDIISELGNILESTVRPRDGMLTVREEVALLHSYANIEQMKYRDQFHLHILIDPAIESYKIFSLLLQPLIENAIFHGIGRKPFIHIQVEGYQEENMLIFKVKDDGCGMSKERIKEVMNGSLNGRHIGLLSSKKRIELKYGKPYGLEIESELKKGTCITIRVPKIMEDHREDKNEENRDCRG